MNDSANQKTTSKYKRLLSNTVILGIGVFGSKLLVFLMMPLYTGILSPEEYGIADLISQTANLLIPIACIGICDGIFRFTMDNEVDKRAVLSSGLALLLISGVVLLPFAPLLGLIDYYLDYFWLIAAYVLASNFHSALAQYIRACNRTKLFSLQGIINTVLVITLNILFLVVFKLGITGYVLSVVVSDFAVGAGLLVFGGVYKDIKISLINKELVAKLVKYSIPMIPATIFWWITSVSDRYMVTYFSGEAINGLYTAAYKIPTLLTLVSNVFIEAWQYSAVKDGSGEERGRFYGNVYGYYQCFIFLSSSAIIALSQILISILCADSYFEAWRYIPLLTGATVFSGFTAFFGSFYLVQKKSMMTFITAMSGAVVNIILNLLLIPSMSAQGAALATLASYAAVFVIRSISIRKTLKFDYHIFSMAVNLLLIAGQVLTSLYVEEHHFLIQILFVTAIMIFNISGLLKGAKEILKNKIKK